MRLLFENETFEESRARQTLRIRKTYWTSLYYFGQSAVESRCRSRRDLGVAGRRLASCRMKSDSWSTSTLLIFKV